MPTATACRSPIESLAARSAVYSLLAHAFAYPDAERVEAIRAHDPWLRGIVVLGLDAPEAELAASFEKAARHDLVRGFAVGRTIFGDVARDWLAGRRTDDEAVAEMGRRYGRLCALWDRARAAAKVAA